MFLFFCHHFNAVLLPESYMIIVPDYGMRSDHGDVVALREACEALRLDARIVTFPEELRPKDGMSERSLIESSAKELASLCSQASSLVVFGKSAMLAGTIEHIPILYINPQYDSEWLWKHQYYADRKQSFCLTSPYPAKRYGVFTTKETPGRGMSEFNERYSRRMVHEPETGLDPEELARLVYRFDTGSFTLPLEEIDEALRRFPRKARLGEDLCRFAKPVRLPDYTALGITMGVPMAKGQSGMKLRVAELDYTLPLERYVDRTSLNPLRDAIVETRRTIEDPAAKVSEVLGSMAPKSHNVTFVMPGIDGEYGFEFVIGPAQLRDAMLRKVLLGYGRRGIDAVRGLETKSFNLRDELRDGIAKNIHADHPELDAKTIGREARVTSGEKELERYLDNLARFIRLVLCGEIPQRLVEKCHTQYFATTLSEDGPDFDKWYDANYISLLAPQD